MFKMLYQLDRVLRGDATRPENLKNGEIQIPLRGICAVLLCLAAFYGVCMGSFALLRAMEWKPPGEVAGVMESQANANEVTETNRFQSRNRGIARQGTSNNDADDRPTTQPTNKSKPWQPQSWNEAVENAGWQTFASMCKVPLLFTLTLLITLPSLYVFNALVGSRLRFASVAKLLVSSLGVSIALLASLGPIVVFFTLSTPNYRFIVGLHVVTFAIAGLFGMEFLRQTLNRLTNHLAEQARREEIETASASAVPESDETSVDEVAVIGDPDPQESTESASVDEMMRRAKLESTVPPVATAQPVFSQHATVGPVQWVSGSSQRSVKAVFLIWTIVFGLVGAQMGWVLRPFIGSPSLPFEWFRGRESNFFDAVYRLLTLMF